MEVRYPASVMDVMDVFITYWRLPNLITYRAGCTALNKDC